MGTHERKHLARPFRIHTHGGSEGATAAVARARQRGEDDDGAVTVIVAYDLQFYEQLPRLFPHNPAMRGLFAANAALIEVTARRNSSLQGAYLMLAARALGLDC